MRRSGTADLPLHNGHVPQWLADRMARMGREIITAVIEEYGVEEVLTRLSDPFWFQALGCVMGMDWHSSGITTSVVGALKKAINPASRDLGLYFCGGRGKHSRNTPQELLDISERTGLNGTELVRASRLTAKVDNTCVQDGFSIYLHCFVLSRTGQWAVIQQGMNQDTAMARRYHWHSASVRSFVSDPHTAIVGKNQGLILNLADSRAEPAQNSIAEFLRQHPQKQLEEYRHLIMSRAHAVSPRDVDLKRLAAVIHTAYEEQTRRFIDALLIPGVGPRTLQSLALVSEVIYGHPSKFEDPARFAFAHGGKDGYPFPVPLRVYDESISVLKNALQKAKLGRAEKLEGIKKLGQVCRFVEKIHSPTIEMKKYLEHEWDHSHEFGGRTVKGNIKKQPNSSKERVKQLSLFDEPFQKPSLPDKKL